MDDSIPVGPLQIKVQLPPDVRGAHGERLVAAGKLAITVRDQWAAFEVQSVVDHEVVVLE